MYIHKESSNEALALTLVILNLFYTLSPKSYDAYFTGQPTPSTSEHRHNHTCTELRGMLADMRA